MGNIWAEFEKLIPQAPVLVAKITAHNNDGTSSAQLPDGTRIRLQGQAVAVGEMTYHQQGRVLGEAPDLPSYQAEV